LLAAVPTSPKRTRKQTATRNRDTNSEAISDRRERNQPLVIGAFNTSQSTEAKLRKYEQAEQLADIHLAKFDDLDFNVFSNQEWARLRESHAEDMLVHLSVGRMRVRRDGIRALSESLMETSA
jgi:hypothetical protein